MNTKMTRDAILLTSGVILFALGVLVGMHIIRVDEKTQVVYSSSGTTTDKKLPLSIQDKFKSFSYAYNRTHLWSMPLANENYYRLARLLPCRTVHYVYGSRNDTLNSCDQTNKNEFSVETTLHAQKWLYEHQNPANCTGRKFAIIHTFAWSGFGSTLHQVVWAFGQAIGQDRIAVYRPGGNWLYGGCSLGNPDCIFLPISNCSIPPVNDTNNTIQIKADVGHWVNPIFPPVFLNRTFNWYRSQLIFYLMRYNEKTLAHVQRAIASSFNPPSIDLHHPFIAVYVRRSDKVQNREMSQSYPLLQYINLFKNDVRRANITTMYLNSEDDGVFKELEQINNNTGSSYKLLRINSEKNIVFMKLLSMTSEQRGKIVLEFLTDLFIEINADLQAGTLTSNYCRMVDEIRLVLGKFIPYYTPENRYFMDKRRKR